MPLLLSVFNYFILTYLPINVNKRRFKLANLLFEVLAVTVELFIKGYI